MRTKTETHAYLHLAFTSAEVQQKVHPQLGERLQVGHHVVLILVLGTLAELRRGRELSQGVRVAMRRLLQPRLPVQHVAVLQQLVQQYQQYVRLAGGHGPGRRSEFSATPQETLDHRNVAAADRPIERPHAVEIDVLDRRAPLQQ